MNPFHRSRLLAVILPMIVWAVYFAAVYALQGVGCSEGWNRTTLAGVNALTATAGALTLVTLAVIAWLGHSGWIGWRRGESSGTEGGRDTAQRQRAFSRVLTMLAALAFISTVLVGVPIVMVPPCL